MSHVGSPIQEARDRAEVVCVRDVSLELASSDCRDVLIFECVRRQGSEV